MIFGLRFTWYGELDVLVVTVLSSGDSWTSELSPPRCGLTNDGSVALGDPDLQSWKIKWCFLPERSTMPTTVVLVNGQHDNHIYIHTVYPLIYIVSYYIYIYILYIWFWCPTFRNKVYPVGISLEASKAAIHRRESLLAQREDLGSIHKTYPRNDEFQNSVSWSFVIAFMFVLHVGNVPIVPFSGRNEDAFPAPKLDH